MALSIALSVIATTGTGIVLGARIVYGMASYRVLPEFLGTVSRRYATPVASSIVVGLLIVILSAVYYIGTSVQNAFFDVIDVTGLLFSIFYILTALAAIVYYHRRTGRHCNQLPGPGAGRGPRAIHAVRRSRTLRVNNSCAIPTGLVTMSGVTAGPGGSRLAA